MGQTPRVGGGRLYLLVQEQVPPQETLLPAQQDPFPTLGLSPAAGLGDLVTVQSQEPKNRRELKVFRPVHATATKLGGEQGQVWVWGWGGGVGARGAEQVEH